MTTPVEVLSAARAWYAAGFCVIPPKENGTKAPLVDWKQFQHELPTKDVMRKWYDTDAKYGIGLVCGQVSGNLEMLELEGRACDAESLDKIADAVSTAGLAELWDLLCDGYSEWTPSGGLHLLYRVDGYPVPGNTKIANRPKREDELVGNEVEIRKRQPDKVFMTTLAETRGEGGYVVVAPSQGPVHPSGNPWTLGHLAEPGSVPTITWDQRNALHAAIAAALDIPAPVKPKSPTPMPPPRPMLGSQLRVGDDFNARGDWGFLETAGWRITRTAGQETFWVRPGKEARDGHSASTGYAGDADRLYVWSSATEFPTEEPISRFAAYTTIVHGGDYRASTKDLSAQGYGEQRKPAVTTGYQQFGNLEVPMSTVSPELVTLINDQVPPPPPETNPSAASPRRSYCQTSVGNAERMADMFSRDFRFVPVKGDPHWMAWDGRRWVEDHGVGHVNAANVRMTYAIKDEAEQLLAAGPEGDELKAAQALYKWFQTSQMDRGMNGTLSQFSKTPAMISTVESFDRITGWLNLPNGMLDLETRELRAHDRAMMFTQMFGTHYDPAARAPKFEQFMETVVPDPEMRKFLQRAIGYSLTGKPNQRAMMILWGLKRTGKSQFTELMQALFGDYGYTAMAGTFHKMDKRGDGATPGQHSLKGKRFVSISETDEDAVLDETAIKRFTGTDSVSTRALYRKDENWKPQCVIWLVTNNKPLLSPDDTAVWDRVKLAHFPTQFSAKGGAGTLKETPDYAALLFAQEAPGILNWALDGLKEFQELGGLAEPEQVTDSAEAYRREVDSVSQFWDQSVEEGKLSDEGESRTDVKILYKAYSVWCEENRLKGIVGPRRFQARLRSRLGIAALPRSNSATWVPGYRWTGPNWMIGQGGGGYRATE